MIKAGQPVFFGCDMSKFCEQASGIMDISLFEYEVCQSRSLYFHFS
jgi:bleomycin hydrolase